MSIQSEQDIITTIKHRLIGEHYKASYQLTNNEPSLILIERTQDKACFPTAEKDNLLVEAGELSDLIELLEAIRQSLP